MIDLAAILLLSFYTSYGVRAFSKHVRLPKLASNVLWLSMMGVVVYVTWRLLTW